MYSVGLDVHQKQSSLCILDEHGKLVNRLEVRGRWPLLLEKVREQVPRPFAICFEASCGYGYLHEKLSALAAHVAVAHPAQLRLIFRSKKKNDRVDAAKLAKLLYLDEVPRVHVPALNVRQWRALIEFRQKLLAKRVAAKNQVRALLRGLAIAPPEAAPFKSLWTRKGLAWLAALSLGAGDDLRRDLLLEELRELTCKMRRVEKELAKIADGHPGITLLKTIPGVGIRTAEAVLAYLDDIRRFARLKQVGSYFGLVPCQDASAGVQRLGHITRDGPATVRKLLVEASWQTVRHDPRTRAFFQRVMGDDPQRRKIALVAVAHRLCRIMASMLRSGEIYRKEPGKQEQGKEGQEGAEGTEGWRQTGLAGPPGARSSRPRQTDRLL